MIQITADTRRAVVTNKELLTTGSAGIQVQFTLSEDWAGLAKMAVFRQGDEGEKVDCVLDSGLTCVVPHEVLTTADEVVFCGIYGSNGQGTIIIPTIWASLGVVRPGTEPNTPATATPTPEIWAQILNVAQDAEATADEAMSLVETGLNDLAVLEAMVESAEASRVSAEQSRVTTENQRVSTENSRVSAENIRVVNENARDTAETARNTAEQSRAAAENARVSAETARVSAEQERVAAEQYREEKYAEYVETVSEYADNASASATAAAGSASDAASSASSAAQSATSAQTKADEAASSVQAASRSASAASSSASAAATSETNAEDSASAASGSAGRAATSEQNASVSAGAAANSATAAQTAQDAAEDAQDAAETAAASVSASAAQIAQNTSDISDLTRQISDVEENQIPELKSALKVSDEETTVIKSSTWETGLMDPNGVVYPSYTSYKYSQQISVRPGDIVRVKKVPSEADIAKATRITAFVNGTADSQYGANDDYTLPYVVPSPVSEIVFTIPNAYFDETDVVYSIDTKIAKSQFEAEINTLIEDVSSIKETTEENSEILDAISDQVITSEDKTTIWESGIMNLDGSVSANSSYIYSSKIPVVSGQTVRLYRAGPVSVSTATRITVYSDNTAKAEKGESDYLMPFIVPDGIDSIVFTIPAVYLTENVFARISSTSYVPVEKQTVDAITEYMSVKGEFYPLTEGSSMLAYAKGILGIWIKNPVEDEEYHLREFRYNQVIGSSKYTKFVIASVNDGVVTEHTIYTLGEYSPNKKIEFFDTDYALVCIDWSKYTSGDGYYAVNLDANTELDPSVTLESNTIAIACFGGGSTVITEEKLVTQVQQIVSVQKEIVESQVDVVDSARNAANHGVLPTNSGSTNFTNLQSLIDDGGTIVIDVPGIYEIDGMLKIGSDTELIFGKQVVMKMMNETGGFIVNKGASTNTYDTNIRISGLHLSCNGKGGDSATYRRGLRGKIAFGFVKNLILDGIYCDDIAGEAYFIHLAAYENVLVENCHIEGNKDGVHSACGEHLTIRNCYFSTRDDPIALNCQDYVASIPYYGWIKDVLIENCVDESPAGDGGAPRARSILVYGGAWTDWASGNTYRNGDTIVASNDCVYRLISDTAITDETVIPSTVEPTHLSGYETESDGCTWLFIQDTPVYNAACENVTVRNYYIKCPRVEVVRLHNDISRWVRSIYPTAIMPPHKNITLENVVIHDNYASSYFVGVGEPINYLKIINSDIDATYVVRVQGEYTVTSANAVTNVVVLSNIFKKQSSSVLILSGQEDRVINVKAYGNYKNGMMYNSVTAGEVNMLANDLF